MFDIELFAERKMDVWLTSLNVVVGGLWSWLVCSRVLELLVSLFGLLGRSPPARTRGVGMPSLRTGVLDD